MSGGFRCRGAGPEGKKSEAASHRCPAATSQNWDARRPRASEALCHFPELTSSFPTVRCCVLGALVGSATELKEYFPRGTVVLVWKGI